MDKEKITQKQLAQYLGVTSRAITDYSKSDVNFPKVYFLGRSKFYLKSEVSQWLSEKAGKPINLESDKLSTGSLKHLLKPFQVIPVSRNTLIPTKVNTFNHDKQKN